MTDKGWTTKERSMQCSQCDTMLFQTIINEDARIIALECNMCGERTELVQPRLLPLNRAGLLTDLIRAVERSSKQSGVKLRYYPFGSDTDKPAEYVLRAFTHKGGGFLREDEDVRDAYVWCSGIFENWIPVEELLDALDNTTSGRHGMDKPMATIDFDKETS